MTSKRTAMLVILDGLGDRACKDLGGKTPLQAAKTPTFDKLASEGQTGLMNVIGPGITPGSDAAHLALFGYDPIATYPGRGPLEALGAGLASKPGDVAFRANFATVDSELRVTDRRAGRDFTEEEHRALEQALARIEIEGVKVHFIATSQHRGAVVFEGSGLSGEVTDTDPHETNAKVLTSEALIPEAQKTAKVINALTQIAIERLKDIEVNKKRIERGLPAANILLLRGAGQHKEIPTLADRYGIRSAVLAGGSLYIGTAKYVGMEHLKVEGQTGTIDTNFMGIAEKAIQCVQDGYDYIFIHVKATDNASHDGNTAQKMLAIERTDMMVHKIIQAVGDKLVLAVSGDHTTPVSVGEHTCDPVPVLLWSSFIRPDDVKAFSEFDCAHGALKMINGQDIMPLLLGYAGYIPKLGA
ncbi:MAG: 2,3-bisphosphoglycerate-independent phosphoglycerate mutase [Candidatus Thorarchaeota archaeon]|nr:2,3-bisphosphoglycerate-independent phosphoglycerate mutase [Candidatus Thorarchaeota archaeon]